MRKRSTRRIAGAGLASLMAMGLAAGPSSSLATASPASSMDITVGADPVAISIAPLPCDRRGEIELSMTNTGVAGDFADALLTASPQLQLSRGIWSTYLPATDPDETITASVTVTADEGTPPGNYHFSMDAAGKAVEVPVTVEESPGNGRADNLALYRQAFASTTHPNTTLCGGVDGDLDSEQWADSGIHDRTPEAFPDTFGVQLDGTQPISRVEVYTLDSDAYPAAEMGIRDFDVQARTSGGWSTVASVEDNVQGQVTLTFPSVTADQVQVVVHDSNDHKYSRIIEFEVYQQ